MSNAILITGGAGFIGGNFVEHFLGQNPNVRVVVLDQLTYAGDLKNLAGVRTNSRFSFEQGDICDADRLARIFGENDIRGVIHFAAESHVDNSIRTPEVFVRTNVLGTFQLIHAAYQHWMSAPFTVRPGYEDCRFHHISTDEVYGSLGETGLFTETTPYAPNSPYSASKAGSDLLVRSYVHTFGLNAIVTNTSNNYGPRQHFEKLIPTVIRRALAGETIPIYGDGKNIRDWLYVGDHCEAIDLVFRRGRAGEVYNIGGNCEMRNLDIAREICGELDRVRPRADGVSYAAQIAFVADRPGHDRRYAIDSTKIKTELGWIPKVKFSDGISRTIAWYLSASHT